jgi:hypothetical protein
LVWWCTLPVLPSSDIACCLSLVTRHLSMLMQSVHHVIDSLKGFGIRNPSSASSCSLIPPITVAEKCGRRAVIWPPSLPALPHKLQEWWGRLP